MNTKLGMLYHITGLCPRTDITMGRCGFGIMLFPAWKEAVAASDLSQAMIDRLIKNSHRPWLDGCGWDKMIDPDEDPINAWKEQRGLGGQKKMGPKAYKLWDASSIRVQWGEWGPEHISVPGDACGLDIDTGFGAPPGGAVLNPHNIDHMGQQILFLVIFTSIAEYIIFQSKE